MTTATPLTRYGAQWGRASRAAPLPPASYTTSGDTIASSRQSQFLFAKLHPPVGLRHFGLCRWTDALAVPVSNGPAIWRARHWLLGPHRFAWDNFFSRNEACWVVVHLKNGQLVGGYFGPGSYATVEPESGHLYLEELWRLDERGKFVGPVVDSRGALFRPLDYDWIEMFDDGPPKPLGENQ